MFNVTSIFGRHGAVALLLGGCILAASVSSAGADGPRGGDATAQIAIRGGDTTLMQAPLGVALGELTPAMPRSSGNVAMATPDSYAGTSTAGSGAGLLAMDGYKAGVGCSVQCITSGVAYGRGVDAQLVVTTDTAARIWVIVWDNQGYYRIISSAPDDDLLSFSPLFDDLAPHTVYQAQAGAEDAQGHISYAYGSFTTRTRNVEVSFNRADILSAPHGDHPFAWDVWAEGAWLNTGTDTAGLEGSQLLFGFQSVIIEDVDQYLDFAVLLAQTGDPEESHWPWPPASCGAWVLPEAPSNGESSCTTWASAVLEDDDLDDRPADATSWTEHTLERTLTLPGGDAIPGGFGEPLNFTVPVTLNVTYD